MLWLTQEHTSIGWESWMQFRLGIHLDMLHIVQTEDCIFGRHKEQEHRYFDTWATGICHFIDL